MSASEKYGRKRRCRNTPNQQAPVPPQTNSDPSSSPPEVQKTRGNTGKAITQCPGTRPSAVSHTPTPQTPAANEHLPPNTSTCAPNPPLRRRGKKTERQREAQRLDFPSGERSDRCHDPDTTKSGIPVPPVPPVPPARTQDSKRVSLPEYESGVSTLGPRRGRRPTPCLSSTPQRSRVSPAVVCVNNNHQLFLLPVS